MKCYYGDCNIIVSIRTYLYPFRQCLYLPELTLLTLASLTLASLTLASLTLASLTLASLTLASLTLASLTLASLTGPKEHINKNYNQEYGNHLRKPL